MPDQNTPTVEDVMRAYGTSRREAKAIMRRAASIASERDRDACTRACGLLLEVCRCALDPARARPRAPKDDLTWSWLEALAHKHGLLPALHAVLDDSSAVREPHLHGLSDDVGAGLASALPETPSPDGDRADTRPAPTRDAHDNGPKGGDEPRPYTISPESSTQDALSQLAVILPESADADLQMVPVKGPTLAFSIYDAPTLRPFADLDLLIRPSDFERADRVLRSLGYATPPGLLQASFYLKHHIHLSYTASCKMKVELHWGLTHRFRPWHIPVDDVLARASMRELNGPEVPCLSDEDHLVYLCTHLEEHGYYSRYADAVSDEAIVANPDVNNRLIWLLDVAMMIDRLGDRLDWEAITERSCRWGVGGHVRSALELSDRLVGVGAPGWVLDRLPKLRGYGVERRLAAYIALSQNIYTRYGTGVRQSIHRFLLSRIFRMHPTLQFRPARLLDVIRYVFSAEAAEEESGGGVSWRGRAVLGAPFRVMRLLAMAASIAWYYLRRLRGGHDGGGI